MYNIDHRSRTPVYEQIIESVKESVMKGVLSEGERLPSVRELAKMMTLNPNTVQRAYRELEQQGVIIILQGRGAFVSEDYFKIRREEKIIKLRQLFKKVIMEAKYLGFTQDAIEKMLVEITSEIEGGTVHD